MSTFKCINPKSYKLTMNNTYEVLEDLGDSIRIINDNNKVANYHKSLFDEVITEPEPVPEIPARTEQDLIDSITFLNDD